MDRMTTVAFIGLGAMGSRMALNLHQAGFRLQAYNGDRATIKLINNMIAAALQTAIAEGAMVAEAANLDRAAAVEVLNEGAAGSRALKMKLPKMFNREFSPQFALELMDKDVRYFLQ